MKGYIDGFDFFNMDVQKYYAPPNSWSEEKKRDTAISRIFSGEWWGAQKRDGAFYMFLKDEDGNMFLRSRSKSVSGDYLDKIQWVPHLHKFFNRVPTGSCFLGELYLKSNEQAKSTTAIMNSLVDKAIKRQEKEKLRYYIFDVLAWGGENLYNDSAEKRFKFLWELSEVRESEEYVDWAQYFSGKKLWNELQLLLSEGYEGMVIINGAAPYQPGKRPSKDCLKIKKELQDTIDCFVLGANPPTKLYTGKEIETWAYWYDEVENKKLIDTQYYNQYHKTLYELYVDGAPVVPVTKPWFFGWAGSLRLGVVKDGKDVEIGNLSGVTDEIKENWKDYVDCPIEVTAMEVMDTGGLRHPKFVRFRDDILKSDCTWEKVFGGI